LSEPYSRDIDRVLLSIDTEKTDLNQGHAFGNCMRDDYPVAWVRSHGKGRVFYCTFGHNAYLFWCPTILKFFLAATQFALGDLPCSTTPSAQI
jgi:type 1 glutamine amidotransferase